MTSRLGKVIWQQFKLPFLDTCIHVNDDGSTKVIIYRKPTHTDQYLNFDSNHHLEHKRCVVRTLVDRVEKLVTTPDNQVTELLHVKAALKANGYKEWMYKIPKANRRNSWTLSLSEQTNKVSAPLTYIKGLSENLTNIYSTYHVPINTIRSILVHPKDKTPDANKCGVVYKFSCPQCTDTYGGETSRSLGTRFKKHSRLKPPLLQLVNIAKTTTTTSKWWCESYRQGGTFLEKENKRSHRHPHPTAITQQGRRPRPPGHLRWSAVTWPFPNGRSCDQEGVNTTLNEEVEMTSQATFLLQSRLWKGIYYLI